MRALLTGFAEASGKVWVYMPKKEPFTIFPENIAFEKYLYAVSDDKVDRDDVVERKFFAVVDGLIPPIVRDMEARKLLGIRERQHLAFYAAVQLVRTPAYRDSLKTVYSGLNERQLVEHMNKTFKNLPEELDPNTFEPVPMTEKSHQNNFVMNILNESSQKWEMFALRKWRVLHTQKTAFVTSSIGLGFDLIGQSASTTMNITDKNSLIYFPLSAKMALEMSTPMSNGRELLSEVQHVEASGFAVRVINRIVAYCADRFVIANNNGYKPPSIWCKGGMTITPATPLPPVEKHEPGAATMEGETNGTEEGVLSDGHSAQ
jgi:hypothetical protein